MTAFCQGWCVCWDRNTSKCNYISTDVTSSQALFGTEFKPSDTSTFNLSIRWCNFRATFVHAAAKEGFIEAI